MSDTNRDLPGDPHARASRVARMIRVDHAGEYGAARIYEGQLAVLGRGEKGDILRHMKAQEQVHLDTFAGLIAKRRVRPTALLPFWHLAGFALGAVTAALGERAAMACTVAVEEAIDEHYARAGGEPGRRRGGAARHDRAVPRRGAGAPRHRARARGRAGAGLPR